MKLQCNKMKQEENRQLNKLKEKIRLVLKDYDLDNNDKINKIYEIVK